QAVDEVDYRMHLAVWHGPDSPRKLSPLRYCEKLRRASRFLLIATEKFRKSRRLAATRAAKWPSQFRASTVRLSPSPRERLPSAGPGTANRPARPERVLGKRLTALARAATLGV